MRRTRIAQHLACLPCARTARRRERGTQIAELAVVLPLLAFLALIVSEGAGVIRAHQVINNAAREGARMSAQESNYTLASIQSTVADYACLNGVKLVGASASAACTTTNFNTVCGTTGSTVTVNRSALIASDSGITMTATQVTVTCSYPLTYLPAFDFPTWGMHVSNSIPLRVTATFRNFWSD